MDENALKILLWEVHVCFHFKTVLFRCMEPTSNPAMAHGLADSCKIQSDHGVSLRSRSTDVSESQDSLTAPAMVP